MTRLVCVMINILPTDRYLESTEIGGDKVKEQGASDFTGALEQTQTLPQQHWKETDEKKDLRIGSAKTISCGPKDVEFMGTK